MFDLTALQRTIATQGPTARIVIANHEGSSPRDRGTSMLIWAKGQSGTIGGGALEWEAVRTARAMLPGARPKIERIALGPKLGQCCGGAVTLVTEVFCAQTLPSAQTGAIARSLDGSAMPLNLWRLLDRARAQGVPIAPQLIQGWMVEPVVRPTRHLWIWGAGHVGRALVEVLAPLPDLQITWVDIAADRFPGTFSPNVDALPAADPAAAVCLAPQMAEHLIVTFSHALDLDLCHRLLTHGFLSCGLIGSATKWARFRARLAGLGHAPQTIARISCPIGQPALGKHPQAIAIGVSADFLAAKSQTLAQELPG
jgi:xanthine dehydrogenase accessory factor